ncbi:inositol monophosphatase family protein [Anaerolineales bacterium HSG25]|nr:inositol monophosphatase family protein [Anaerolineales bacterium HSG25]
MMYQTKEIINHLDNMFQIIRRATNKSTPEDWHTGQTNAKGDQVKWFDLAADEVVCTYLDQKFPYAVNLWSEEGDEPRQFGRGKPEFTMVLDPVDGSENFARGLAPAGTAFALFPASEPVSVETVQHAFIGNLFTGDSYWAAKGEGAFFNDTPLRPMVSSELENVFLSCDTNRYLIPDHVNRFMTQFRGVRSLGAATIALTMVATGSCAVHLDSRDNLTPENFLAPALLINEVGGVILTMSGEPISAINTLTECFSLLAATTPELHALALETLQS